MVSKDRWSNDDTRIYYSFTGCPEKDAIGKRDRQESRLVYDASWPGKR